MIALRSGPSAVSEGVAFEFAFGRKEATKLEVVVLKGW